MAMEITMMLDKIEAQQSKQLDLSPAPSSLDLLRAVYRDPTLHLSIRMRAAMACLPFETPKLLATAIINEGSVAELLDRRIAKLAEMERQQKLIEAKPIAESTKGDVLNQKTSLNSCSTANQTKLINGGNADVRLPPTIPDHRFRRI